MKIYTNRNKKDQKLITANHQQPTKQINRSQKNLMKINKNRTLLLCKDENRPQPLAHFKANITYKNTSANTHIFVNYFVFVLYVYFNFYKKYIFM